MIVNAVSLWKKFNLKTPLDASEWGMEDRGGSYCCKVTYNGHKTADGCVRIFARFFRPRGKDKKPVILLLPDVDKPADETLIRYFTDKGYAVLTPDYAGETANNADSAERTVYPPSLFYGNFVNERGLYEMAGLDAEKTTWFEWTYVALYSIEYLKSRTDLGAIGIVGVRTGGELAWKAMLSPDVKCGIPINAAGWQSSRNTSKFEKKTAYDLGDDYHSYVAAAEAQSYAPYVKCPVLMLCALRDKDFDCDRAYDTYTRIGNAYGNALTYSIDSGGCIGQNALTDMDLFLEKNLKGREIYIPNVLNVSIKETDEGLEVQVDCDKQGILEEAGVYYAEADIKTRSAYREWRQVFKTAGRTVKNSRTGCVVKPFAGAKTVYVYAYAKYINGFRVTSKITSKNLTKVNPRAIKNRNLFTGSEKDCFEIADYKRYSLGGVLLERELSPKILSGYGELKGAYAESGIRTYKISSPQYFPEENALLKFDVYTKETQDLEVCVEVASLEKPEASYSCTVPVRGGGKWKRIILRAADFKGSANGTPLENFKSGNALVFRSQGEEKEFAVSNILWL